jgi:hypothetical protein
MGSTYNKQLKLRDTGLSQYDERKHRHPSEGTSPQRRLGLGPPSAPRHFALPANKYLRKTRRDHINPQSEQYHPRPNRCRTEPQSAQ